MEGARLVAERLRSRIAERPIFFGRKSITVSVSIGVAGAGLSITGIHDLMKRVDEALHAAKRNGRNRVIALGRMYEQGYEEEPVIARRANG
jgi:diguanylate cyclase (GGDEF)-like protein